jgi:hypothetical protein
MTANPISSILAAEHPLGYWGETGDLAMPRSIGAQSGSSSFSTSWAADPVDAHIRAACEYVLAHTQAPSGGFAASSSHLKTPRPP